MKTRQNRLKGRYNTERRSIPLRALMPNAITTLALCSGLTAIRYAVSGEWENAVYAILISAVLDTLDGRIARLLKGATRFGAELDSLSDVIAFGVAPAILLYLWTLQSWPRWGWLFALSHAVCCALRLARFNVNIDYLDQPHKSAGFLTGVPAPAGANLSIMPLYAWFLSGFDIFRSPLLVGLWVSFSAFLMIADFPTFGWSVLRVRPKLRLGLLVMVAIGAGAFISAPWAVLAAFSLAYTASLPFGILSYSKVNQSLCMSEDFVPPVLP
ncbi:MAG: CDP-diacylglycerol--serine O-phosphatidyltransferase [Zymomonas mobilis subsp. pomaceae]|uniref:CDP-diacylglycerol--serine O-phosphatidyltransferase n=1 Tax=Zymomonas mobilis subsp. pomaceae (strain ATCC 29192 / DSM 22645 / JCM 10191 / CCUG 17912 / NBRC 13757 / NCIMB 11200 / NRRL B-4491 / Barker I) TaxID=579138 RepID=F8ETN4_ZYMMT|nr:CDP-diacylglycerol--serine O-phosphatidyltransferase [Zymomonas mobilis]AEI37044.1 CDP-diacylglycerol/serine O-phosphatidyltransferase [Zymomonas mobilis subsp. pomaceae ATCC 29192]MDX5948416.1 CDP-diacylglycerol--serine O-phosphatidyltransferase [Zymomonas mobilis subsp. pomaceae]GEB89594.1 CDP-diacylglycerol--serine O-phosphatidyltransferase [Zymomonas mobilis subsp. pomaceae]